MMRLENMMLRFSFIIVAFVSFGIKAQDLTIATFNCEFLVKSKVHIKYGFPYSMKDADQSDQNRWKDETYRTEQFENACKNVAQHIRSINSDIIGLAEVGNKDDVGTLLKYINKDTEIYKYHEVSISQEPTGQHVALLSKYPLSNVKLKIEDHAIYFKEDDLDESDITNLNKSITAEFKVKEQEFKIVMLHLKSERGGYESDTKRIAQAEIARRAILKDLNNNKHVIVMGDLNSEKRSPTILRLRGFDDIYGEMIQTGDDDFFKSFDLRYTYNYKGTLDQIDHILLSTNFVELCGKNNPSKEKYPILTEIIQTPDKLISDHNAIKVSLFFK